MMPDSSDPAIRFVCQWWGTHFELDPSPDALSSRFHLANSLTAPNVFFRA
jgi:hypothetical protein